MSPAVQAASIAAWNDEVHVIENRRLYTEKFKLVTPMLKSVLDVEMPDAAFYAPKEIYRNQVNVDNVRLLRGLGSDRLHQQMIDMQYK